ncbi:MAG: nucleoside triphosphate pyrophosphohydrolase, partial [Bacteroidetes bacterium RIFCSPLOWO2_12_FULL_37_12]
KLLLITNELRERCPWDREQTIESIRHLTIEEVHELSSAILSGDTEEIKKELGDLIMHVVFYSRIASEMQKFNIADVLKGISEKLIRRHPHVYGKVDADNSEKVKKNWEKIKLSETNKSVLDGVPLSLPSLIKAFRIQEKVAGVGFDWTDKKQVLEKVKEEIREIEEILAEAPGNTERLSEEIGDALFALVNFSRFSKINPDDAMEKANRKFQKRFIMMEDMIKKEGKDISKLKMEEWDLLWEEVKKEC